MVQTSGLHDEHGILGDVRICEKPMKSLMCHQAGAFGKAIVSFGDDSVIELALCDVYSNNYGYCTTSRVKKMVPFIQSPVLREALCLINL